MSRSLGVVSLMLAVLLVAAVGYLVGAELGQAKGYLKGQSDARLQIDSEVQASYLRGQADAMSTAEVDIQASYERGFQAGHVDAVTNPPTREAQCDIKLSGRTGSGLFSTSYNVYLESNPTDFNNYYSVWRYAYDPSDYFFEESDFNTADKIKDRCTLIGRRSPDSNSLIITEGSVNTNLDYVYCVIQDDGDFSEPLQFK